MDRKTLDKVAHLARLKLTEDEANTIALQLTQSLEHFEQISKLDTANVEPLVTPIEMEQNWRTDEVRAELSAEQMLANAPAKQGLLFTVPPVV